MALTAKKKKGILLFNLGGAAIGGTCCGLSFVPWRGSGASGPRTLRYGSWYPRFVLGSADGEDNGNGIKMPRELYVEASNPLIQKGANQEIPFEEVTMKWGTRKLQVGDVLVETCTGEGYYIARHEWNDQFRLDTWEKVTWSQFNKTNGQTGNDSSNCKLSKKDNGRAAKTVKLSFQGETGTSSGGGDYTLNKSIIKVGNCSFKLNKTDGNSQKWTNLEMKCKEIPKENGGGAGNAKTLTLTGKHEHYYIYTVTK